MRILFAVLLVTLLSVPSQAIPQALRSSPISPTENAPDQNQDELQRKKLRLEIQKLNLEINELDRKAKYPVWFKVLNKPVVTTGKTLIIGGLLFGILSDRRARRNKRLDEYVLMINNVAGDLASVFTPFDQYIRHPSHRLDLANHRSERRTIWSFLPWHARAGRDEDRDKQEILRTLHERIPLLYERRLSVYVTAEAVLPSKGVEFANQYFEIYRYLQFVERQLRNHSLHGNYDKNRIPQRFKENARENKTLALKSPFKEFDQWVGGIWVQADDLLTQTLKHANLSNGRWNYWKPSRLKKDPLA